jgi:phage-related protein
MITLKEATRVKEKLETIGGNVWELDIAQDNRGYYVKLYVHKLMGPSIPKTMHSVRIKSEQAPQLFQHMD